MAQPKRGSPENSATLFRLIDLIYSAVNDPSQWQAVLEGIADAVHGESTAIFAQLPDETLISMTRTDPFAWNQYAAYYGGINPISPACDERFPDGQVRYSHHALADGDLEKSEFYNDFFRPQKMHYSFGLKLPMPELPSPYLSCQRSKNKGPFTEEEGRIYQILMPHLQRAIFLHLQFNQLQSRLAGMESALDAFGHPVFGVNNQGRAVSLNREAEKVLQTGEALKVENGVLSTVSPECRAEFAALVSQAVETGTANGLFAGGALLLPSRSGHSLRVTVTPFRSFNAIGGVSVAALVFVSDPAAKPASRSFLLQQLYRLTPTEIRLCELMLRGMEVREASAHMGIAFETGRFHVKRILTKTGTNRQAELLRLILSVPGSQLA